METSGEVADNLKRILLMVRRALYMVIREIEHMYHLEQPGMNKGA